VASVERMIDSRHFRDFIPSHTKGYDTSSKTIARAALVDVAAGAGSSTTLALADAPRESCHGSHAMTSAMLPARHKIRTMLPIFHLRLRNGASIGPALLRRLWSLAAESEDVSVARDPGRPAHASIRHTYVVSAPGVPWDVAGVETKLRSLLQERLSAAHVELTRLV
jgi:hypothetical protein